MSSDFINNTNSNSTSNASVALRQRHVFYGSAIGLETPVLSRTAARESIASFLRFYYGEYVTGILFIFALCCYTFIVPASVNRPGLAIAKMIDKSLKKALDIIGALIGLVFSIPIFVVMPVLIKLDSSGPVFYTQDRVGVNRRRRNRRIFKSDPAGERRGQDRRSQNLLGRPIRVMKFRTMVVDAELDSGPVWATQNDSRVTRLGRFMRKTRLDEIPQLINVLKGDMSLVGPRPERPYFVRELSQKVPKYTVRLRVKPGITGLAQVNRGYDSSVDSVAEKVKSDISYIRNWSIWSDVKILMKTVVVVITGKGAC